MTPPWRVPALVLLGTLLVQAAWILALPPFRGTDEFDHAYRAAAVAGGQWRSSGVAATDGRGLLVRVPRSLVEAARPVCASYTYTGHDNCNPVAGSGRADGTVDVASAAATYNPVFYWVIGSAAAPFSGGSALEAMRVASGLLCAATLALAAWTMTRWSSTRWPLVGLVTALSPVVVFSTAVAAPNGLEICASVCLWLSLLGLHSRPGQAHAPTLLRVATLSAVVVCTLRSIGPLWVLLIALSVLLPLGLRRARALFAENRRTALVGATAVLVSALASVAWSRSASTNALESFDTGVTHPLLASLEQVPLWLLQAIAAFPRRSDAAPALVYVLIGGVCISLVAAGFIRAPGRVRLIMLVTAVLSLAVPLVLTFRTIEVAGPIWQGRYGLPYVVGLPLAAGTALGHARTRDHPWTPPSTGVLLGAGVCLVVAQTVSVVHVLQGELRSSPLATSPEWLSPPAIVVAVLMVAGSALLGLAVLGLPSTVSGHGS